MFTFYKGNCEDIHFKLCTQRSKKCIDANLDEITVPSEYLVENIESMTDWLSILKDLKLSQFSFSKMERKAVEYAIRCVEIVEKQTK